MPNSQSSKARNHDVLGMLVISAIHTCEGSTHAEPHAAIQAVFSGLGPNYIPAQLITTAWPKESRY